MKYKEWIELWFENYVKPTSKTKTCICYTSIIQRQIMPKLGDYDLDEITPLILQKFVTALLTAGNSKTGRGLSSNTVNLIITIIQESLETAVSVGVLEMYIADKIKRPKTKERKVESFSLKEQKLIEQGVLKHKKSRMLGVLLCLYTGLRIGELLALEWKDIDLKKRELSVNKSCTDYVSGEGKYIRVIESPKTETSIRTIPIPKQLVPILKELKTNNKSKYVVGDGNKTISIRSYQRSFEAVLRKLNISHKGFHALRHTFATRALESGMDVKTLSEILGHKNPTVTLTRYAHAFLEHKRQMMDKLGNLL